MRKLRTLLVGGMAALVAVLAVPAGTATAAPPKGPVAASLYSDFVASVAPGASFTRNWKLPPGVVPEVGLSPVGASTTALCQFESPRGWFTENSAGSVRYWWTVKKTSTLAPGASSTVPWNNANTLNQAYWMAMSPPAGTSCALELTRQWYQQRVDAIGTHRDIRVVVKNVGSSSCAGDVKFAVVT